MTWIVILAIVWGNPDSRIEAPVGDVIKIERIEVASEAQCLRAAQDWTRTNVPGPLQHDDPRSSFPP